jgi:transcriptional regulator with XRE-family HTH domain
MSKSLRSPDHVRLVEILAAARKRAGLTQRHVAEALGRPQSFVAKYEGGERRLDVVEFVAVARALGADPLKLLRTLLKPDLKSASAKRRKGVLVRRQR